MQSYENPAVDEMRHALLCKLYAQTDKLAYLARDEIRRRAELARLRLRSLADIAMYLSNPYRLSVWECMALLPAFCSAPWTAARYRK
jgi:hypothetical protein